MSRFNLLYTFIVYTLLLHYSLCANLNYSYCKNNQTCGGKEIPYPLGLRESGCGLPGFQIDCEENGYSVMEIGSRKYTVLEFFPENQTSEIAEGTNFQNCSLSYYLKFNEDAIQALVGLFDQFQRRNISLPVYECGMQCVSITATRGTPGYVAPELWSSNLGPVTDKSDVYSFGMVLLEIAGRTKNIDVQVSRSSQLYFPEWAFKLIESGELEQRLRERGRGDIEKEDEEKVRRMTKAGLWCIQYNSNDRPSMSRVVQMLEGNGDDVSNPPLPFNSSPPREAPLSSSTGESSSTV